MTELPEETDRARCDNCGSDDRVRMVEYDAMVDGPGDVHFEWRCSECRTRKPWPA